MCFFFLRPEKERKYFIVVGDITCKACVIQLHHYLDKRVGKKELLIALRNKGHFILNESSTSYYKAELPKAVFTFFDKEYYFPAKERYPYLIRVCRRDSVKTPYDSLFTGENLNLRHLE
jgi:hypothetical protein